MGDDNQCGETGLAKAATNTLVLAFEVSEDILEKSPKYLISALKSPEVAAAIEKALREEAEKLSKASASGKAPSGDEVIKALGDATLSSVGSELAESIGKSAAVDHLKTQLSELKCSFERTPVGVWVNKNEGLLIIVAAGLAVGGAAALYHFRVGDKPTQWALDLAKPFFQTKLLGALSVGASKVEFTPSQRSFTLEGFLAANFKAITGELKVRVVFVKEEFKTVAAQGKLVLPIVPGVSAIADGSFSTSPMLGFRSDYLVGLGIDVTKAHKDSRLHLNIRGQAGVQGGKPVVGATLGLKWEF